jgi:hypothetical protein
VASTRRRSQEKSRCAPPQITKASALENLQVDRGLDAAGVTGESPLCTTVDHPRPCCCCRWR